MDHDRIKDKLSEFYDRELPEAETREIERHLAGCQECRAYLERRALVSSRLFSTPPVSTSGAFVGRVMAGLEPRPAVLVKWFAPAVGIAAMLLLSLVPAHQNLSTESLLTNGDRDLYEAPAVLMEET